MFKSHAGRPNRETKNKMQLEKKNACWTTYQHMNQHQHRYRDVQQNQCQYQREDQLDEHEHVRSPEIRKRPRSSRVYNKKLIPRGTPGKRQEPFHGGWSSSNRFAPPAATESRWSPATVHLCGSEKPTAIQPYRNKIVLENPTSPFSHEPA